MKRLGLLASVFLPLSLWGQFHDNTTLLGYRGGPFSTPIDQFGISTLTFDDGKLQIAENFELGMYFDMTNAVLSDSNGVLQTYTNGGDIGNTQWDTLENGETLTNDGPGPNIWPQLALALPKPGNGKRVILLYGNEEIYWPFGTSNQPWVVSQNLYAAEIDMSLNNGLGKVISKGQIIIGDTLSIGKFTATKHANGRDWWILAHEQNANRYYRLLLDPTGVHQVGVQAVGLPYPDGVGQACFSPNGEKYVVIDGIDFDTSTVVGNLINVYDFDRCTGLLSNPIQFNEPVGAWVGGAISPNSRYFYAGFSTFARQYDLWANDIEASGTKIMEYDGYEAPFPTWSMYHQLMPDGKIYICSATRSNVLHVIQNPDEPGLACNYEQHAIHLPTRNSFSIPNFPCFRLGPLDNSSCDTLGLNNMPKAWYRYEQDTIDPLHVDFHDLSYYEPTTWYWDFGDGSTASAIRHPVHQYDSAGVYEVCLTVSNINGTDTHCKTLYLGVSATDNPVLQDQIQVGPNPFSERLSVALSTQLRSPQFRLFDVLGRLEATSGIVLGINEIDTHDLKPGMYFWEVRSGQEVVKTGKVVKM